MGAGSRLNVQPVDSSVSDPEARGSAKAGDVKTLLGNNAKPQTRDIQTCRHCGEVMPPACVTDRPTDRVDVIIINHLPNALRENQTHPGTGGFFRSLRAHRAGLPPLPPSLPPKSMGRRLASEPGAPGRLSGGGRGAREKAQPEQAKRAKSFRAAGSEPQRN